MKIFFYGLHWYNHFEEGVHKALLKKGVEVKFLCRFELSRRFAYHFPGIFGKRFKKCRDVFHDKLADFLRQEITQYAPEWLLIFGGENLKRSLLEEIKHKNIKIAAWFVDDPFRSAETTANLDIFDLVISHDKSICKEITKVNAHAKYLFNCTDIELFSDRQKFNLQYSTFSFIGNAIGEAGTRRACIMNELTDHDITIYGDHTWQKLFRQYPGLKKAFHLRTLSPQECCYIYRNSTINLNINHPQNIHSTTQRTFDIPAAGGFQLADYNPCLEELFEPGEMVWFSNDEELSSKADYYLKNQEARTKVIELSRKRVVNCHTFDHRVVELLKYMAAC